MLLICSAARTQLLLCAEFGETIDRLQQRNIIYTVTDIPFPAV